MAKAEAGPGDKSKPRADMALVERRVDEILRIRLDGAEWWDVREFVREKQGERGSNWFLEEGETPLSDGHIRRYQSKADALLQSAHEPSRKKLRRRHLAQRRNLYAKASTSGDLRTALACLQDEAKMLGLYPSESHDHKHSGGDGKGIPITFIEVNGAAHRGEEEERPEGSSIQPTSRPAKSVG